MNKRNGSCNCGATTYELTGDVKNIVNCHCDLCRKMNGGAFSTYAVVSEKSLNVQSDSLSSHSVSENALKNFCANCGTPMFNSNKKYDGLRMVYLGSLDDTSDLVPAVNIYCESRLNWLNDLPEMTSLDQGF